MKMQFEVIGKQRWNMTDEQSGRQITGSKLFVTDGNMLNTPDKVGLFPTTFNVDYAVFDTIQHVPGTYELDLEMKVGSKGQFNVGGVRFVGDSKQDTAK